MKDLVIIAHDIRSTHNIGSLMRTAEGLGVQKLYLTGYTPYPEALEDERLPHIRLKLSRQIRKTALGAENSLDWEYCKDVSSVINKLKQSGYTIAALEQSPDSLNITRYKSPDKLALLLGREVEGIEQELLNLCDITLEIPMKGTKESFNVTEAATIAMYHCLYML